MRMNRTIASSSRAWAASVLRSTGFGAACRVHRRQQVPVGNEVDQHAEPDQERQHRPEDPAGAAAGVRGLEAHSKPPSVYGVSTTAKDCLFLTGAAPTISVSTYGHGEERRLRVPHSDRQLPHPRGRAGQPRTPPDHPGSREVRLQIHAEEQRRRVAFQVRPDDLARRADREAPAVVRRGRERDGAGVDRAERSAGVNRPFTGSLQFVAWANVSRRGNYHRIHNHPGSSWSGVYYVDAGQEYARPPAERAAGAARPAPFLRRWSTRPASRWRRRPSSAPRSGSMVIFPGWMYHFVNPYQGDGERISSCLSGPPTPLERLRPNWEGGSP